MKGFSWIIIFSLICLYACSSGKTNTEPHSTSNPKETIKTDSSISTNAAKEKEKEPGTIKEPIPSTDTIIKKDNLASYNAIKDQKQIAETKQIKRPIFFIENNVYDFGTIEQGEIVNHQFNFTNVGNAPLEIKNPWVSCGCTQPSYPFVPIQPNQKGTISVRFDSKDKEGNQNAEITFQTNGKSSEIALYVKGIVVKPKD